MHFKHQNETTSVEWEKSCSKQTYKPNELLSENILQLSALLLGLIFVSKVEKIEMYNYHVTVTNICICAIKTHPTVVIERHPNDQIPEKRFYLSVRLISYTTVEVLINSILTEKGFFLGMGSYALHSMHNYIWFSQSTLGSGNKGNSSNVQTEAVEKRTNLQI